jgi:hypothetical protein
MWRVGAWRRSWRSAESRSLRQHPQAVLRLISTPLLPRRRASGAFLMRSPDCHRRLRPLRQCPLSIGSRPTTFDRRCVDSLALGTGREERALTRESSSVSSRASQPLDPLQVAVRGQPHSQCGCRIGSRVRFRRGVAKACARLSSEPASVPRSLLRSPATRPAHSRCRRRPHRPLS